MRKSLIRIIQINFLNIKKNDLFKTYTYWMLSQGNLAKYQEWYAQNEQSFTNFANWVKENRIDIKDKYFNSRIDY